ncbi:MULTISPECIES: membrane protein insertion efficiency factor YidD [unclassified Actinotalea]|uniref:membrane protein insertion efficiency factor YidD n=1 Tax=unclassified Actinotalea TaxID=2638618 RepID=UPI0015F4FB0E|nr:MULTISPECIES: membrane protein insertion efficiency factor YidD [unclassified Actinotalea]
MSSHTGAGQLEALRQLPRMVLVGLLRAYQLVISPLSGPTCRYYPSCSSYALLAVQRHGAVRGTWLAVRRLARCHPWTPGGVDDVPPARVPQTCADEHACDHRARSSA